MKASLGRGKTDRPGSQEASPVSRHSRASERRRYEMRWDGMRTGTPDTPTCFLALLFDRPAGPIGGPDHSGDQTFFWSSHFPSAAGPPPAGAAAAPGAEGPAGTISLAGRPPFPVRAGLPFWLP